MSRSKHTRPPHIIAADRIRDPRGKRSSGDCSSRYHILRILKEFGIVSDSEFTADTSADLVRALPVGITAVPGRLPKVSRQRPRKGFLHPADRSLIRKVLMYFGELSWYGVREICLAHSLTGQDPNKLIFGRLSVPGKILLYEQPEPPWLLIGKPEAEQIALIENAGAILQMSQDGTRCKINWPNETLAHFMLFDVLMHEIGHHIVQQFKGKREVQVLRRKDHEALALTFARRCRQSYFQAIK